VFIRFRQTKHRLQVSIAECRRSSDRVRQEHIASCGSVPVEFSIQDRLTFWRRLFERFGRLANRINAATQQQLLGAISARIPMVTPEEQRALQLENDEIDERFWTGLQEMHAQQAQDQKRLAAAAEKAAAASQEGADEAVAKVTAAKERIERLKRGENVEGGLGKPLDIEQVLLRAGFTKSDLMNMRRVHAIGELGKDVFEQFLRECLKDRGRAEKAFSRRFLVDRLNKRGLTADKQSS
jgi:regulator of replication initiation timing